MGFRNWISEYPIAAVSLAFGSIAIFIVAPLIWFNHHGGGEYFGAVVGFAALLAGALLNAHLTRIRDDENKRAEQIRDDRLHARELYAATAAIQFEMIINRIGSMKIQELLEKNDLTIVVHLVAQFLPMLENNIFLRNIEKLNSALTLTDGKIDINAIFSAYQNLQIARGMTANTCTSGKPLSKADASGLLILHCAAIKSSEKAINEFGQILEWVIKPLYRDVPRATLPDSTESSDAI